MKVRRFSEEQIIGILRVHEAGAKTPDLCRRHGISDATFQSFGFQQCGTDDSQETGFEKIAIYHHTPECLTGMRVDEYGSVVLFMKWPVE